MMNRRDFMKLSAASAVTMGAVAGMAPASFAENAGVHTDAEVQAMVAEELRLSREVAFYPAAFRGDFDKFYVLFHKLSRAQFSTRRWTVHLCPVSTPPTTICVLL